jgi:uncharacterized membrane protein HdeD (DUF308 family)
LSGFRRHLREVIRGSAIVDDDLGIRHEMHRLNSGDQAGGRVAGMGWCARGHQPGDNSGIDTLAGPAVRNPFGQAANLWWFWLIAGIFWVVAALIVLQFDGASITAVGMMIGLMFLLIGLQNLLFGALVSGAARWILWIFGVLFLVAGVVLMISPEETFAGVADILGFIFLLVGIFWLLEALTERDTNELWWFGLISGIAMLIVAFWTGGQFFIETQYVLLVFTGILSLFHGVSDLIKAFEIRELRQSVGAAAPPRAAPPERAARVEAPRSPRSTG